MVGARTGERVAGANDAAEAAQAKSKRARIGERSVGVGNRTWTDVARKPLLPFTAGTQASLRFEARQTRIRYGASFLAATKTSSARDDVRFACATQLINTAADAGPSERPLRR